MGFALAVVLLHNVITTAPEGPPAPRVAIVLSSRREVSATLASGVCEKLQTALAAEGVTAKGDPEATAELLRLGAVDPRACDGSRLCLARLAEVYKGLIIGVDLSSVQKYTAGHIDAVGPGEVALVASTDFNGDATTWAKKSDLAIAALAREVAVALKVRPAPTASAPVSQALVPAPSSDAGTSTAVDFSNMPRAVPYAVTGAAALTTGLAIGFLAVGLGNQGTYRGSITRLPNGQSVSSKSDAELNRLSSDINTQFSASLGLGITSVVLGGVATYLLTRDAKP